MEVICRIAKTQKDREHAFRVRNKVFTEEQGLFAGSDVDEYDSHAIHILAECDKRVVGTVRVYQIDPDTWMGGRLAVLKEYRRGTVGSILVRRAVRTVADEGAKRFFAYIQQQNVTYFKKLGWQPIGQLFLHYGLPHQKMEADLNGKGSVQGYHMDSRSAPIEPHADALPGT